MSGGPIDGGPVRGTLRLTTSEGDLARAAELLRAGGLVAVPTETVYGLAVRADDPDAVARLFAAKGRPADNPLIVHVADVADVDRVAATVTPLARTLLDRFAPGPLTVVLPARDDLPRAVTGGLDTVAVRVPDDPVARTLLRLADVPLAAPSANRSSRPSPTSAAHVLDDLDGRIDAVVDAGPTRLGLESTVVDARGDVPHVLREGGLDAATLAAAAGLAADAATEDAATGTAALPPDGATAPPPRAPGTRHRHYAPHVPVHVAAAGDGPARARELAVAGGPVGLVAVRPAGTPLPVGDDGAVVVLAVPVDVDALAADLFALLRRAETAGVTALVVEAVPEVGVGRAVMDRLRRAAAASGGAR